MTEKKHIVLDATLLSSLMRCPCATDYRFNQLLVQKNGKSNSLECGSLVHIILEHYNKSLIAGKLRAQAIELGFEQGYKFINGCDKCLFLNSSCPDHKQEPWLGLQNTPELSQKSGKRDLIGWKYVIDTMQEYFDFWKMDSFTVIAAEEVRGRVIYQDDEMEILWKAKFDEIDDTNIGFVSKDHKTMSQNRDQLSLNNQFIGQCVILKSRSIIVNKIGFQKSLKAEEKFLRPTISYSADRMAEWANEIVPFYARMLLAYNEANSYPRNYAGCDNKYGKCDYVSLCETDRGIREETAKIEFVKGRIWDISND